MVILKLVVVNNMGIFRMMIISKFNIERIFLVLSKWGFIFCVLYVV